MPGEPVGSRPEVRCTSFGCSTRDGTLVLAKALAQNLSTIDEPIINRVEVADN
jgi:hypothetical protein